MTPPTARLVVRALGATLILGACQDATAPERTLAPTATPVAAVAAAPATGAMKALGAHFGDATDPFLGAVADLKAQRALRTTLLRLSEHLADGKAAAAAQDVTAARALLAELEGAAVEMAPIALALDNAELVLKGETPGGVAAEPPAP